MRVINIGLYLELNSFLVIIYLCLLLFVVLFNFLYVDNMLEFKVVKFLEVKLMYIYLSCNGKIFIIDG